jgi:hypothetical protein
LDGKARVLQEELCDGAHSVGSCPGALTEIREAMPFDHSAVTVSDSPRDLGSASHSCYLCGIVGRRDALLPLRTKGANVVLHEVPASAHSRLMLAQRDERALPVNRKWRKFFARH